MRHIEDSHQMFLMQWSKTQRMPARDNIPAGARVFDDLVAIPNGGKRNAKEAARMKAGGVKAGMPDMLFFLSLQWCGQSLD